MNLYPSKALIEFYAQGKTRTVCPPQKSPKQYCFTSSSVRNVGRKSTGLKMQGYKK